jgi:hypothetical protein
MEMSKSNPIKERTHADLYWLYGTSVRKIATVKNDRACLHCLQM